MLDYSKLSGKKLLILGATADECKIIDTARQLDIHTIVTDYNEDWNLSPAKNQADEAWNISWSDVEQLSKMLEKEKVDGVIAGYSEHRIQSAIALCKKMNMPFYVDDLNVLLNTFDKQQFKSICRKNGIPVTKDYYANNSNYDTWAEKTVFPVVVKPVDYGGSRGIRTCFNKEDLVENMKYARSFSKSETVIVEELIKDGQEVVIYYTMADGEIVLSAMCDKYERVLSDGFNSLPDAYIYPSRHLEEYIKKHNRNVIRALKKMGMRNGSANLQGFYTKEGEFVFF